MKKATLMGALLAMLVICLSALTTVSASAAEWLCNKLAPKEKECLVLSVNLSVLLLNDMTASSEVECPVESVLDEGWVGPGAADEITSVTFVENGIKCKPTATAENLEGKQVANTCIKVVKAGATNLPWFSKLETIKEVLWDTVKGKGAKAEPAYAVECEVAGGIKINDKCEGTAVPALVLVNNLAADEEAPKLPLVDILFLLKTFEETEKSKTPEAEWGTCTIGKEHTALVEGEILNEAFINNVAVALEADK